MSSTAPSADFNDCHVVIIEIHRSEIAKEMSDALLSAKTAPALSGK